MRLIRILAASFSLSLRRELTFRANLVFQLLLTIVNIASSFLVLNAVYTQTRTLGGWRLGESIILLGTFQMVSGIYSTFVEPNLSWFTGQVRAGKLDSVLVQPIASLFMVSLGKCAPLALSQVMLGLLAIGIGWHNLGTTPTWWGILGWLILLSVGLIIAWSARILLACLSLWTPSMDLDVLYSALWQFGRYPVDVYRQPLSFFLTYVLPFAFLATFPAGMLTGRSGPRLLLIGIIVSALAILFVHLAWQISLRRYTSATS
ncbi:hypothetical protein KDA_39570 [Dictyobacter alpinus]|uniref:ABC transporter permease n=1 Tax=Dictyobacter alpinus TaxID=2014873 RepID=A0A402BAQ2_9CHLR|nr:ABC-2 family transporter protein [Dictyobacter alpinus]GCE28473.1 hypothetical protein KDA_39570 [Dictyobacter alpinus]